MVILVAYKLERQVYFNMRDNLLKATRGAAVQFTLQPQYTDNPQNICEGVITNAPSSVHGFILPGT